MYRRPPKSLIRERGGGKEKEEGLTQTRPKPEENMRVPFKRQAHTVYIVQNVSDLKRTPLNCTQWDSVMRHTEETGDSILEGFSAIERFDGIRKGLLFISRWIFGNYHEIHLRF